MATKRKNAYPAINKKTHKYFRAKAPLKLHAKVKTISANENKGIEEVVIDLVGEAVEARENKK